MYPVIYGAISVYLLAWALAAVVGTWLTSQTLPLPQLNPHFDPQVHAAGRDCVLSSRAGLADNNPTGAFTYPEWTDTRIVSQPQPDPDIVVGAPPSGC